MSHRKAVTVLPLRFTYVYGLWILPLALTCQTVHSIRSSLHGFITKYCELAFNQSPQHSSLACTCIEVHGPITTRDFPLIVKPALPCYHFVPQNRQTMLDRN